MRSILKWAIALAAVVCINFGTSFTERIWKENPKELFGGNFNLCLGPSKDGRACEQLLYFRKTKDNQAAADIEVHLSIGTEKTPAWIGLITPIKLKIVGSRFCARVVDMVYSHQSVLYDIVNGKTQNKRNATIEEDAKLRDLFGPQGKDFNIDYACMTLEKRIGTEKYIIKTYGNEYFGFARHIGSARVVDSDTNLLITPIPFPAGHFIFGKSTSQEAPFIDIEK